MYIHIPWGSEYNFMNCYFIGPFELELETLNYELEIELRVRDSPTTTHPTPRHQRRPVGTVRTNQRVHVPYHSQLSSWSREKHNSIGVCSLMTFTRTPKASPALTPPGGGWSSSGGGSFLVLGELVERRPRHTHTQCHNVPRFFVILCPVALAR